ncbi:MAG: hypothetical protein JRE40_16265 [Deltaproteobacteria bacterium]|nr:hypothetical protein [Deltaproteobacteria bacterium]
MTKPITLRVCVQGIWRSVILDENEVESVMKEAKKEYETLMQECLEMAYKVMLDAPIESVTMVATAFYNSMARPLYCKLEDYASEKLLKKLEEERAAKEEKKPEVKEEKKPLEKEKPEAKPKEPKVVKQKTLSEPIPWTTPCEGGCGKKLTPGEIDWCKRDKERFEGKEAKA